MKLFLLNTQEGLKPLYDEDYDLKKRLKVGKVYKADISIPRNYEFFKKYHKLISLAWEYQNEAVQAHFKTRENFRKTVEIAAGHCERVYHLKIKDWVDAPKSISFASMTEEEFQELYERVKDVLFAVFLKHINETDFYEILNF